MNLRFIDPAFKLPEENPFSPDGRYDNWVMLKLCDTDRFQMMTLTERIFCFRLSSRYASWPYRLMDYLHYQSIYGRSILVACSEDDYHKACQAYDGHSIYDQSLRVYEPKVLIHSTTRKACESICRDGFISSWNRLKRSGKTNEPCPIGKRLGDPEDFSDYVMLGSGTSCEIVVNSKQKGHICMDENCSYQPGVRFYFDTAAIAANGLLVRDGAHIKVKEMLPLKYAVFCATIDNVSLSDHRITPKAFAQAADEAFSKFINNGDCLI